METQKEKKTDESQKGFKPDGCMAALAVCLIGAFIVIAWLCWTMGRCWLSK